MFKEITPWPQASFYLKGAILLGPIFRKPYIYDIEFSICFHYCITKFVSHQGCLVLYLFVIQNNTYYPGMIYANFHGPDTRILYIPLQNPDFWCIVRFFKIKVFLCAWIFLWLSMDFCSLFRLVHKVGLHNETLNPVLKSPICLVKN